MIWFNKARIIAGTFNKKLEVESATWLKDNGFKIPQGYEEYK